MSILPRYPHVTVSLDGTLGNSILILARLKEALESAKPPIEETLVRQVIRNASSLDKSKLLSILYETVNVVSSDGPQIEKKEDDKE